MSSAHRLLYRGALSLPDTNLLLDGLTFFAPVLGTGLNILNNPLALALESMRGRPSLSFVRVEKLRDLCMDMSGDVRMSVSFKWVSINLMILHVLGTFTRMQFCLAYTSKTRFVCCHVHP
jgi:hypothetical protein